MYLPLSTAMTTCLVGVAAVPLARVGPMMRMRVKGGVAQVELARDGSWTAPRFAPLCTIFTTLRPLCTVIMC